MRPGDNGELIIQGQTEAAAVAHFLLKEDAGGVLGDFEPPIDAQRLGYLAFVSSRIEDLFGTADDTEYVYSNEQTADAVAELIALTAMSNTPWIRPPRLGRRAFLQGRLQDYFDATRDDAEE